MLTHRLKINDDKTELLGIGTNQQLAKVPNLSIKVGSADIKTSDTARNLGVIFDDKMTMEKHVNDISKRAFSQLRRLRQIRQYLSKEAIESLVHSFVSSTLDYCNAVLYGCAKRLLDKLQKVQNCAARVVIGGSKYDHVKPLLKALHWLPVAQRIDFKIALLTYKCLNGFAPKYLVDLSKAQKSCRALRSNKKNRLNQPMTRTKTLGTKALTYAAPTVWNSLPDNIKNTKCINTFKRLLKTHYFKIAFN